MKIFLKVFFLLKLFIIINLLFAADVGDNCKFMYYINEGVYGAFNLMFTESGGYEPTPLKVNITQPVASFTSQLIFSNNIFGEQTLMFDNKTIINLFVCFTVNQFVANIFLHKLLPRTLTDNFYLVILPT